MVFTCAILQVVASYDAGDGLKTQYDWLVLFIFMVGTYVFTVGCSLLYVDANNADYPQLVSTWNANGKHGRRPRSVQGLILICKVRAGSV